MHWENLEGAGGEGGGRGDQDGEKIEIKKKKKKNDRQDKLWVKDSATIIIIISTVLGLY